MSLQVIAGISLSPKKKPKKKKKKCGQRSGLVFFSLHQLQTKLQTQKAPPNKATTRKKDQEEEEEEEGRRLSLAAGGVTLTTRRRREQKQPEEGQDSPQKDRYFGGQIGASSWIVAKKIVAPRRVALN